MGWRLALLGMLFEAIVSRAPGRQLLHDPGFEGVPVGPLSSTGFTQGWEVQKVGREAVQNRLLVMGLEDATKARSGRRCLLLAIPKETVGFEFVTVGQRIRLAEGKEYEASVWVRWLDGPDTAPANANPTSGHPSAIVSFWARHREGTGDFAGRDEWLFDNRWHRLAFRFRPTDPTQRTLVYLSLLPHQSPADIRVFVDDFELYELEEPSEVETRTGNIVLDPSFTHQVPGPVIAPPWHFANIGGANITGEVIEEGNECFIRLTMPKGTTNFESAQLWQDVELREGVRYEIRCRMRWDNYTPEAPAPIVNYGIYHEDSHTWYGPIDQILERSGEWNLYRFVHVPPFSGRWRLYVQLNGWGNFGRSVIVSFDDFVCAPVCP